MRTLSLFVVLALWFVPIHSTSADTVRLPLIARYHSPALAPTLTRTSTHAPTAATTGTPTLSPTATETPPSVGGSVYITNTGTKYHRWGCRYLSASARQVTCSFATTHGYSPCSVCRPSCP